MGAFRQLDWKDSEILLRIREALRPPVLEGDRDRNRVARFLNGVLWAAGALGFLIGPVVVVLSASGLARIFSLVVLVGFLLSIWGLRHLLHAGRVRLASTLLTFLLWAVFTAALTIFGGIRNPLVGGYLIVIFLAGYLLGRWGAIGFGSLSAMAATLVFWAELNGAIVVPLQPTPRSGALAAVFVISAIATALVSLILRDVRMGLERAVENEQALSESYRALRRSRDQLQAQAIELERHTRYLEATAEVAQEAVSVLDVEEMLDRVVQAIIARFDFYRLGVFLIDSSGQWAVLRAAAGEAVEETLKREFRVAVGEEGIVGFVTGTGEAYVAPDVFKDDYYIADSRLVRTRSEMALPLRVRGEIIGALDVQSVDLGAFDRRDVAVFQSLADQLATAISNARLFEQVQESLENERRAYADIGRKAWAEIVRAGALHGYRYHRGKTVPLKREDAGQKEDGPVPGVEWAQPADGEGVRADGDATEVAIPIKLRGGVIGTIRASKEEGSGEWSSEERAMMESLAGQLGAALESARLYESSTRRAERERLVAEITAKVRASSDVEGVMRTAVQELGRVIGADRARLQLMKAVASKGERGLQEDAGPDADEPGGADGAD